MNIPASRKISFFEPLTDQNKMNILFINSISDGVSGQRLLPGGYLGPRSFFWLILTSFGTSGTIVDQYLVKGVHQWSCRKKI